MLQIPNLKGGVMKRKFNSLITANNLIKGGVMKHRLNLLVLCFTLFVTNCGLQLKSMGGDSPFEKSDEPQLDPDKYWDERRETVDAPQGAQPDVVTEISILKGKFASDGFAYVYGGKTAWRMQPGTKGKDILTCYMDNKDYSGVTISLGQGKKIDLTSYRQNGTAGIAFWAKTGPGVNTIYFGIIDDDSDDKKVQSKVILNDYGQIDTAWNYFMIPIRKFQDKGLYWDAAASREIINDVDWSKINEIRFSVNRHENRVESNQPVILYVHDISIIKEIPGYVNPDDYWNAFRSDEPDYLLHDFDSEKDHNWHTSSDSKSSISVELIKSTLAEGEGDALAITYKLTGWCDAVYSYLDNNRNAEDRDWSGHWGIKFDVFTERPYQPFNLQVQDGSNELFIATAGASRGWSEVIVPFKDFYKFPYYQPPEAEHNGVFDLKDVVSLDFKPSGEGTRHTFLIDNIRLTNDREVKKVKAPEFVEVTVEGVPQNVVTEKIHEGIFGINATTWDGDLLHDETARLVKEVNHNVIRFPGGLTSDEYHWKEALSKDNSLVGTDEFLDFCKRSGNSGMITVNFGSGTSQEAAEWVRYTNIEKKANIKYWEIGNELYGDWHSFNCSAEEYGKRAREYIKAMKAVDPHIHITVVWMLAGDWNKTVFEYTRDIVDGVNVHHYPQESGQENDAGLLGSPQSLDDIIPDIRSQLKEFGEPGKEYQIWLTEWNSVDFRPSPQILTIVNAVFVADYLGMLTRHNIEHASYWNIHNNIMEQGGDYGYLSRTNAPDGTNTRRPSYWSFQMASMCLGRGALLESKSNDLHIASYLSRDNGSMSLMLINKYPETRAETTVSVPGFKGKATLRQLRKDNVSKGPEVKKIDLKEGMVITLPAYSVTTIMLD